MARSHLLFILFFSLTACATISLPIDKLASVSPDRVFWVDESGPNAGTLVFARDRGLAGSAARVNVYLDGRDAGIINNGELLSLRLAPGRHMVKSQTKTVLDDGYRPQSIEVTIEAGKTLIVRIGFEADGRPAMWQDLP